MTAQRRNSSRRWTGLFAAVVTLGATACGGAAASDFASDLAVGTWACSDSGLSAEYYISPDGRWAGTLSIWDQSAEFVDGTWTFEDGVVRISDYRADDRYLAEVTSTDVGASSSVTEDGDTVVEVSLVGKDRVNLKLSTIDASFDCRRTDDKVPDPWPTAPAYDE